MGRDSEIGEAIHRVKLQVADRKCVVTIPAEVRERVGFFPGGGYLAVRAVGPVVVIALLKTATDKESIEEADCAMDAAVHDWIREHGAKYAKAFEEAAKANGTRG
jgi:hypothetical protein